MPELSEQVLPGAQMRKYWEQDGVQEIIVDDENQLYRRRPYQGVIPYVRDTLQDKKTGKVRQLGQTVVRWVGFQQKALLSRIFIQTDRVPTYTIFKPDPRHIVVEFPRARFRTELEQRTVYTHEFNTQVARIDSKRLPNGSVQVIIRLKEPTDYLFRQEGDYVFIDIER